MSTEFCSPYCEHMIFNGSCLCQQLYYDRERELLEQRKKRRKKIISEKPFHYTFSMIFLPGLTHYVPGQSSFPTLCFHPKC